MDLNLLGVRVRSLGGVFFPHGATGVIAGSDPYNPEVVMVRHSGGIETYCYPDMLEYFEDGEWVRHAQD